MFAYSTGAAVRSYDDLFTYTCDAHSSVLVQGKKGPNFNELPLGNPTFMAPKAMRKFWTSCRLFLAPPWRKFKKGSVLVIEVRFAFHGRAAAAAASVHA